MSIKKKVKKMNENKIVTIFLATVATIVVVFFGVVAFFSISTGSSSAKGDDNPHYIMKAPDPSVKDEPGKDQGQQGDKENQNKEEEDKVSTIASLKEMLKETEEHNFKYSNGEQSTFEVPINGAMGFTSCRVNIYGDASLSGTPIHTLEAGQSFVIKSEKNTVWQIETGGPADKVKRGYISNKNCFINLPDVIPSIIYNITNSSSSLFVSSNKQIDGVTGKQLFDYYLYSARYGKQQYIAPVLYTMAHKICKAQRLALAEGNTLVIYEAFRPYETQQLVAKKLLELCDKDSEVRKGIEKSPWSLSWFISTSVSNHQIGCAIDVSLAKVNKAEIKPCGIAKYVEVTSYTEHIMQTQMHELSAKAVSLKYPVSSKSKTAWKSVAVHESMTESAIKLRDYCTSVGMSPLASEWWHFNDLDAREEIGGNYRLDYNFGINIMKPVESTVV